MFECASPSGHWSWYQETRIASDAECGRKLLEVILQQLAEHCWSPRNIFGIHLALEEALVNAIKHGNKYSPEKQVRVCCGITPEYFSIKIEDEGAGFDPSKLPDPRTDEWIDVPNGRGVLLMRKFMDKVEYSKRGNEVLLEKFNKQEPPADDSF